MMCIFPDAVTRNSSLYKWFWLYRIWNLNRRVPLFSLSHLLFRDHIHIFLGTCFQILHPPSKISAEKLKSCEKLLPATCCSLLLLAASHSWCCLQGCFSEAGTGTHKALLAFKYSVVAVARYVGLSGRGVLCVTPWKHLLGWGWKNWRHFCPDFPSASKTSILIGKEVNRVSTNGESFCATDERLCGSSSGGIEKWLNSINLIRHVHQVYQMNAVRLPRSKVRTSFNFAQRISSRI